MLVEGQSMGSSNCPQCHAPLDANARFCGRCGRRIEEHPTTLPETDTVDREDSLPGGRLATEESPPPPRRRHLVAAVGVAALVLVAGAALLFDFLPGSGASGRSELGAEGGGVLFDVGVRVEAPAGTFSQAAQLSVSPASATAPAPAGSLPAAEVAGPAFIIESSSPPQGPLRLELPFDFDALPAGDDSVVVASYFDEATDSWRALPGEVDWERRVVSVTTEHLSWWRVSAWDPRVLLEALELIPRSVMWFAETPRAKIPTCAAAHPPYVSMDFNDLLLPCVEAGGADGEVVLRVANNRAFGIVTELPAHARLERVDAGSFTQGIVQLIARELGDVTYIPPAAEAELRLSFDGPADIRIETEPSMLALGLEVTAWGTRTALLMSGVSPELVEAATEIEGAMDCFIGGYERSDIARGGGQFDDVVATAFRCVTEFVPLWGTIATGINLWTASGQLLVEQFQRQGRGEVSIIYAPNDAPETTRDNAGVPSPVSEPLRIEHDGGVLELPGPAQRVVTDGIEATGWLLSLGIQPVGVSDADGYGSSVYPALGFGRLEPQVVDVGRVADTSAVAGWFNGTLRVLDDGAAANLAPDLVVRQSISEDFRPAPDVPFGPSTVAPTILFDFFKGGLGRGKQEDLSGIEQRLLAIARAVGREDVGEALLDRMRDDIELGGSRVADSGLEGRRFLIIYPVGDPAWVFRSESWMSQVLESLGLSNAISDGDILDILSSDTSIGSHYLHYWSLAPWMEEHGSRSLADVHFFVMGGRDRFLKGFDGVQGYTGQDLVDAGRATYVGDLSSGHPIQVAAIIERALDSLR